LGEFILLNRHANDQLTLHGRTAVFSFEGIGLIIPIADSMREPRKFPRVLTGVMLFLIGKSHSQYRSPIEHLA